MMLPVTDRPEEDASGQAVEEADRERVQGSHRAAAGLWRAFSPFLYVSTACRLDSETQY